MASTHARSNTATEPQAPTRDLILDEAERLITLKGVYGFTLKDIVEPLGVQVPSIYKHYSSRDDVFVALARRFVARLSEQFSYEPAELAHPTETLKKVIVKFARFHVAHPAYVRLSLIDFATPDGGMEYIRLAAGGPFRPNLSTGPLSPMHRRLRQLLAAGQRAGEFRLISALDLLRVVKASLLIRLVFPDDLLVAQNSPRTLQSIDSWLWDVAYRYTAALADQPSAATNEPSYSSAAGATV
jgi:AcrR family transcriptional regulator